MRITIALASLALIAAAAPPAVTPDMVQTGSDIPAHWQQPEGNFDYVRREVMIPMRDGVKLHTVILIPKGAHDAPILLTRTPYDASSRLDNANSPDMLAAAPQGDAFFVKDGYIRVFQDVRGKYGSEGTFIMTRPPIGPLNPSKTDDTTDAWDTIDWLVKNLPQSNGKVGMLGSSYEGWTVVMALLHPHPALKVAAPESPMVDGWMGDDWFHYGAFRQVNLDYFTTESSVKGDGKAVPREDYDDYTNFLKAGSAGHWAVEHGFDQLGFWNRVAAHPAYDAFWQDQALDKQVAEHPSTVPTIWLQGLWDQEDMYGAIHSYQALVARGYGTNNHLVMGPWRHSQVNYNARTLGPLTWDSDTAVDFRRDVLLPFFDRYLKDEAPAKPMPPVLIYNTGEDHWDSFASWPAQGDLTPLYLQQDHGLAFAKPAGGADSYVSDPAHPVPYLTRPISFGDEDRWKTWLVQDQRFASDRPDVLTYETPVLTRAVRVQGVPYADLFARTTGTDADWVVKIIDVYPGTVPDDPRMGGDQLAVSLDIFRGRYRHSFANPEPIPAGETQEYRFRLPAMDHVFEPGHRIMVQIQSSLFPVYDRNPQTYVPNIFFAKPSDYKAQTMTVEHGADGMSAVLLPVVAESRASGETLP